LNQCFNRIPTRLIIVVINLAIECKLAFSNLSINMLRSCSNVANTMSKYSITLCHGYEFKRLNNSFRSSLALASSLIPLLTAVNDCFAKLLTPLLTVLIECLVQTMALVVVLGPTTTDTSDTMLLRADDNLPMIICFKGYKRVKRTLFSEFVKDPPGFRKPERGGGNFTYSRFS